MTKEQLEKMQRENSSHSGPPKKGQGKNYPFESLKVMHYFFVPNENRSNLANKAVTMGKGLNRKFAVYATVHKNIPGFRVIRLA